MRRLIAALGFTAVLAVAAVSFTVLPAIGTRASAVKSGATFLIPASEGYGVAECLIAGSECGRVVADSWCEAQGYGRAERFGVAAPADLTGSVPTVQSSADRNRPISITCAD